MENYDNEHTYSLITAAQSGDENAKNQLAKENMKLVFSISRKFYGRGYDDDDINQVGALGLVRAIERFDTSVGVRFSTYAVPHILGEIRRFLRDNGPIKVSRSIKQTAAEISRLIEEKQKNEGVTPGILEISKALKISVEDVVAAKEASVPPESFQAVLSDGKTTLSDILSDKEKESEILVRLDIKNAISSLPEREQKIIIMRYFEDKTQAEIAKMLGISQVQVSRIEKKILLDFRRKLSS